MRVMLLNERPYAWSSVSDRNQLFQPPMIRVCYGAPVLVIETPVALRSVGIRRVLVSAGAAGYVLDVWLKSPTCAGAR